MNSLSRALRIPEVKVRVSRQRAYWTRFAKKEGWKKRVTKEHRARWANNVLCRMILHKLCRLSTAQLLALLNKLNNA